MTGRISTKKTLLICAALVGVAILCYLGFRVPSSLRGREVRGQGEAVSALAKNSNPSPPAPLPQGERAEQRHFDRAAALAFHESVDPKLRAYIVELNARSFLPTASLDGIFSENATNAVGTVYLQFLNHPTNEQRTLLKSMGVDLINYVSGYAWTARGTDDALKAAARLPFVRALARVDPRDKLQREVYLQTTPDYARTDDGSARFSVIAAPGTTLEMLRAQWGANVALANVTVTVGKTPSVLGPRFDVVARADRAEKLAAADSVLFVEHTAPPVANRDATTDATSNIAIVRDSGDLVDGTGIRVAVREIGKPLSHVDFASRLFFIDNDGDSANAGLYTHATAVVGQVASSGVNQPTAKGVAPNATVLVYSLMDSDFGTADIVDGANQGARVSNHSYGPTGTTFGDYQSISADWDAAVRSSDLITLMAGNEESDAAKYNHIDYFVGCKNGLCIEATSSAASAGNPNATPPVPPSGGSAFFAKFGPMNDSRVKPDLVAYGVGVVLDTDTNSTTSNSGTSFSTPATTGVATLVFQRYKAVFSVEPSAALAKALLCGSATDLGQPGPDAVYGFGIVNAQEAIRLIDLHASSSASPFSEGSVGNGDARVYSVVVPPGTPTLKVTSCWMDVAGNPTAAKALVNDLDMLLIDPNGVAYFPYSLSAAAPSATATNTAPNIVDPIEQTIIANPVAGTWTIKITGTSIPSGTQAFAVCANLAEVPPTVSAAIDASPTMGDAPLAVSFSAVSTLGNIVSYQWDFGDGTTGSGATVSHTYTLTAPFPDIDQAIVTLAVTDAQNNSSISRTTITIFKPTAAATKTKVSGSVNLIRTTTDTFQASLTIPELIHAPIPAGSTFTVSAGIPNNAGFETLKKFFTFTVTAKGSQLNPTERFAINARTGVVTFLFRNSSAHDLVAFYNGLGITTSSTSITNIPLRVQVETNAVAYKGDVTLTYKGRKGIGRVK